MADAAWISYTGAITGIVGAITGIAGAVMGYISYRRTEDLKSLDLRLELKKAESDLHLTVSELPGQIEHAKRSRQSILSANGQYRSGIAQKWATQWEQDLSAADEMLSKLPSLENDYSSFSQKELEARLVSLHREAALATKLKEKYEAEVAADEKERDRIRASHANRA